MPPSLEKRGFREILSFFFLPVVLCCTPTARAPTCLPACTPHPHAPTHMWASCLPDCLPVPTHKTSRLPAYLPACPHPHGFPPACLPPTPQVLDDKRWLWADSSAEWYAKAAAAAAKGAKGAKGGATKGAAAAAAH